MVLDSSAIVAVHLKEPGYVRLITCIEHASILFVGSPTLLETAMVLSARLGQDSRPLIMNFCRHLEIETIPFSEDHYHAATTAFLRFGRGRHPAGLNFGDCMSYAIAAQASLPLLFTGEDFAKTDIAKA